MPDYLPRREGELAQWTGAFALKVGADPGWFAASAAEAAGYVALQRSFAAAYRVSQGPSTRTPVAVREKDGLRDELVRATRSLVGRARARPGVTGAELLSLGLRVGPGRGHHPRLKVPTMPPRLSVVSVRGRRFELEARDREATHRRAMPRGAAGLVLLASIRARPGAEMSDWWWVAQASRPRSWVSLAGKQGLSGGDWVWFRAQWYSPTGGLGPWSEAVRARVGDEMEMPTLVRGAA